MTAGMAYSCPRSAYAMTNFRHVLCFSGIPPGPPTCHTVHSYGVRFVNTSTFKLKCAVLNHHPMNRLQKFHFAGLVNSSRFRFHTRLQPYVHSPASHIKVSKVTFTSDIREYSTGDSKQNENEKNDGNSAQSELKGVVVHVPNPMLWIKNKWYSYMIRFSVDPAFNLEEFLTGAKQV